MKSILTAIANPVLNEKLKQTNEFKINYNDIQYQEGVIEILKKEKIDILILSEILPGEYNIKDFILEIKKLNKEIEIIIFLENKKENLEMFLKTNGIFNIYYNNEIDFSNIIKNIKKENKNIELINKIIKENYIIKNEKQNFKKIKNKLNKIINKFKEIKKLNKIKNNNFINTNKIIIVTGSHGVGKSIFIINLAFNLKNKKILIIDLDIINNYIHTLLSIKIKKRKHTNKIENLIIKYNKKIDIINFSQIIKNNLLEKENINNYFKLLKNKYDYILIDSSLECLKNENKKLLKNNYLNIFLIEPNLIEIKKSINILNIFEREWNIKKEKINIIFNKFNIYSINFKILKNIFSNYKIIGKINFNINYNLLINKNFKCKKEIRKIKKDYLNIIKKL